MSTNPSKLFCKLPFSRISIDDEGNIWPACCPDWVAFPLGNIFKQSWEEIWLGETAQKFRGSMFDGSLRYCKRGWCPHVADAESGIKNYHVIPLEEAPKSWDNQPPIHLNMNYDQTCNLKCPSCRADYIHLTGPQLSKVQYIQHYVETQILPQVESIALTGVGDPFMSSVFRDFLINYDSKKYPNIKRIHFHTNGLLLDEKMYEKMKGLHHLDLSVDISIDAASEAVYTKVRPPGKWDKLMKNLQFIKTLPNLKLMGISMVVQQDNYKQMMDFIALGESLVYKRRATFVEFKRMRKDPHLSAAQYATMGLDDLTPDMRQEFETVLTAVEVKRQQNAQLGRLPAINHNLQEFLSAPVVVPPPSLVARWKNRVAGLVSAYV
jgi:molybdenum cofactor biosynthesis enzyme MoaA